MYSTSREICIHFMLNVLFTYSVIPTRFAYAYMYILHGYFTGTGAIIRLPQCQGINLEEHPHSDHINPKRTFDNVIKWKHFLRYWYFVWGFPVTGEFPTQRPVMWSYDAFFNLCLNKSLSKQSRRWWSEMPSHSLWRHCNVMLPI